MAGLCGVCLLEEDPAPWELLAPLGQGGMGTVWLARLEGREVALKLADEGLRLEREARLLARVRHPNVVRVLDHGDWEGQAWAAMERVDGPTIEAAAPLSTLQVVELGLALCSALAAVHAEGVVHRDVKPANVLLSAAGPVLVDFGIARGEGEGRLTRTGLAAGTPGFVAPEALEGREPSPAMDVYGLAATLAFAATGRLGAYPSGPLEAVLRGGLATPDRSTLDQLEVGLRRVLDQLVGEEMPADERTWRRVAALALTACTGIGLAAFVTCITPVVLEANEVRPLVMSGLESLPDGRVVSRMRFEEGPILGAVLAAAGGAAVWALVLRHWRLEGLTRRFEGEAPQGAPMLALGVVTVLSWAVRHGWEGWLGQQIVLIPLLGGLLEVVCLWLFWSGLLEVARTGRSVLRQPRLLIGMGLALVPPIFALVEFLANWSP